MINKHKTASAEYKRIEGFCDKITVALNKNFSLIIRD